VIFRALRRKKIFANLLKMWLTVKIKDTIILELQNKFTVFLSYRINVEDLQRTYFLTQRRSRGNTMQETEDDFNPLLEDLHNDVREIALFSPVLVM